MKDSTKDVQVCTTDHASQKATMGPGVIPQDMGVRKCPEGQPEHAFGNKPDAGGKE